MIECGMELSRELAARAELTARPRPIPFYVIRIMEATEAAYRLPQGTLRKVSGRSRNTVETTARKVAIWLTRQLTDHSSSQIGVYFGAMHHTSVLYCSNRVDAEPVLQATARRIQARLEAR